MKNINKANILSFFTILAVSCVFYAHSDDTRFIYENEISIKNFSTGYANASNYNRLQHKINWQQNTAIGKMNVLTLFEQLNDKTDLGFAKATLSNRDYNIIIGDNDFSLSQQTIPMMHLQGIHLQSKSLFQNKLLIDIVAGEQNFASWGGNTRGGGVPTGTISAVKLDYKLDPKVSLGFSIANLQHRSLTQNANVNLTAVNASIKATKELAFSGELSATNRGHAYITEGSFNVPQVSIKTGLYKVDPEYTPQLSKIANWAQDGRYVRGNISLIKELPLFFNVQQYLNLDPQTKLNTAKNTYNSDENWGAQYTLDQTKTAIRYSQWVNDRHDFVNDSWSRGSQTYVSQPFYTLDLYWRSSPVAYKSNATPSLNYQRQENAIGFRTKLTDSVSFFYENQQISKVYSISSLANEEPQKNKAGLRVDKMQLGNFPIYGSGYFTVEDSNNISGTANRLLMVSQLRLDYQPLQSQISAYCEAIFTTATSAADDSQTIEELKLGRDKTEIKFGLSYSIGEIRKQYQPVIQSKDGKRYSTQEIKTQVIVHIPFVLFIDEEESFEIQLREGERSNFNGYQVEYQKEKIVITQTE